MEIAGIVIIASVVLYMLQQVDELLDARRMSRSGGTLRLYKAPT